MGDFNATPILKQCIRLESIVFKATIGKQRLPVARLAMLFKQCVSFFLVFVKFNTLFPAHYFIIHPLSGKLFLLSAPDHLLFIFKMTGELEHIEVLDQSIFNKPEGIAFLANGDMLISNEGQNKQPTLLRFKYQ